MNYLKRIWTVIMNIAVLLIALAMFNKASYGYEKIILSLLVIIYINIISFFTLYSRTSVSHFLINYELFKQLKKQLKLNINEADEKEVAKIEERLINSNFDFYINNIFTIIFYIVAIFNILTNL